MRCACNKASCKGGLFLDAASRTLVVEGKGGLSALIYVNADSVVELIRELRRMLLDMTEIATSGA